MSAARRRLAALAAEFEAAGAGHEPLQQGGHSAPADERHGASRVEFWDEPALDASTSTGPAPAPGRHRAAERVAQLGQWQLSSHHLAVLALGFAVLVAAAAWWSLRSDPSADPVPVATRSAPAAPSSASAGAVPAVPGAAPAVPGADAPQTAASAATEQPPLVVDVTGKVRRPGIVELPPGARVVDALHAAGGPRPGVDTSGLNLARPLVDGEQIVVGVDVPQLPPPPPSSGSAPGSPPAPTSRVDLNTATQEQLEALPGIGPVTATAILSWRTENGPFTSVDQLLEVSGIGDATLADIEPYVYV